MSAPTRRSADLETASAAAQIVLRFAPDDAADGLQTQ
jgi:hypothetical protein